MIKYALFMGAVFVGGLFAANPALASCCLAMLGCCDGGPCCSD